MSLRLRFIILITILIGGGFYVFSSWVINELRPRYLESVEEVMVDQVYLLSSFISQQIENDAFNVDRLNQVFTNLDQSEIKAQIYNYTKTKVDMRVYITDKSGLILFDSSRIANVGDDYSKWNDVYSSLKGNYGARTSKLDESDPTSTHLYVSAPIKVNGKIEGVITLVKSTQAINAFITSAKPQFLYAIFLSLVSMILIGGVISKWIVSPINQLKNYAKKITQGERAFLPKSFSRIRSPELDELARDFYLMKESLDGKSYIENYIENLTHELKSPLTSLQGSAELLKSNLDKTSKGKLISNIESESIRMKELIERILSLSHIEKLDQLEDSEKISISEMIRKVIRYHHGSAISKKIKFVYESDDYYFRGNPFLIEQMLDNLIKNALDFSLENSKIIISTLNNADFIIINISDEGVGIPDYAIEKVFDKFYSLPRPDSRRKSTGLGLSFVKEIVELHRGDIKIQNLNPGLQVEIKIPI